MFTFKATLKQRVFDAAAKHLHTSEGVSIVGYRPDERQCLALGIKDGHFFSACFFNGSLIAKASSRNWRLSYENLLTQLNDLNGVQPTTR